MDASVFLSLNLSPDAHRREKKKERGKEAKRGVLGRSASPRLYPRGAVLRKREGAWAM